MEMSVHMRVSVSAGSSVARMVNPCGIIPTWTAAAKTSCGGVSDWA